ncbi:MAG: selenide, water dikinase SelD [Bacteriovoracaceae bacterium]|nr:selenide, water dikinase SelD [Bacteriovoracaceae bacterium]
MNKKSTFDLLTTVAQGGCSAKLPATVLHKVVANIPKINHENLLVGTDTSDDASVWKISDDVAIIQTTDFFPAVCSDPFEFGQIAAANALSDVFAMGGKVITALNLVMFPSSKIELEVLEEILRGGAEKMIEAGGCLSGGHTIDDDVPKYGLAVTGTVHPDKIISNDNAKAGDVLILTKPLGAGVLAAGWRNGKASEVNYRAAIENMKILNMDTAEVMQKHSVRCCTDVTGFGLIGHLYNMSRASKVTIEIKVKDVPLLSGAAKLADDGHIPCAAFKNEDMLGDQLLDSGVDYGLKMLCFDAQTSGGIVMTVSSDKAEAVLADLEAAGTCCHKVIGRVVEKTDYEIVLR